MGLIGWLKSLFRSKDLPFNIEEVEVALGYHFNDSSFLYRSLKHRSYSQSIDGTIMLSNERLEFLGDSVLNMVVSHHLFEEYPDLQEGDLTKKRSNLVNKQAAALASREIGLDRFILLNDSEENAGGRKRTSIIADTFEAVIGAIYLDGGYAASEAFIQRAILDDQDIVSRGKQVNYKSQLLEFVQAKKLGHPLYRTINESGPDHDKIFTVEVMVHGESLGIGEGKSKKDAQQFAAMEGLKILKKRFKEDGILPGKH